MRSYQFVPPGSTIGILGGGQLGKMMAVSAKQMGYRVIVMDPIKDCPCAQVSDDVIVANYDDLVAAKELVDRADVVTYEFENVDLNVSNYIQANGYLPQTSRLLEITQNRLNEKETLTRSGLKVAPYEKVMSKEQLKKAVDRLGYPSVLKTTQGGYDGKGQIVIRNKEDLMLAESWLDYKNFYVLEQWVPFVKELSVMVVRHPSGDIKTYPVAENTHVNNILHQSLIPARVTPEVVAKVTETARVIAESLQLVGALGVELFLTEDHDIYVNELAPRPHNSGHYTIEASEYSQFEQHIRAICGLPLGNTELLKGAVMVNLLGQHIAPLMDQLDKLDSVHLHLYGKKEAKLNRKMGHVTVLTDNIDETLEKLDDLKIWTSTRVEANR